MRYLIAFAFFALVLAVPASAQGPIGLGPLKLGMTKEEVEAMKSSDGVYLSSPMTPYQYKDGVPKAGQDKFDALLLTPLSQQPLKRVLTFEAGRLKVLYVTLDDSTDMLDRVKSQIAEKYGPGKVNDAMKEEQCIYKNGTNFKLPSGVVTTKWSEEFSSSERIETNLQSIVIAMCPPNLRYGSLGPVKLQTLVISRVDASVNTSPKSLF